MADQSNNRGNVMDQRGENNGALDGNGIARSGSSSGSRGVSVGGGSLGRNATNAGSDGELREGGSASGSASRKTPRGFAAMDPQAQRAIAAKGGRAAHQKGTAHEFTSEEARVAGRKGGEASRGGRRSSGAESNR
jgi:general stress protein YciG